MINRIILYLAMASAVLSWGRAVLVKGVSLSGGTPLVPAAVEEPEEPRYPEAWPVVCSGRVEAIDGEVDLYGQIAGPIAELRVTEGDFVPKGAVLAVIEGSREATDVGIAEGAVEAARARLARAQAGNGKEEVDQALFEVQSAAAALA